MSTGIIKKGVQKLTKICKQAGGQGFQAWKILEINCEQPETKIKQSEKASEIRVLRRLSLFGVGWREP